MTCPHMKVGECLNCMLERNARETVNVMLAPVLHGEEAKSVFDRITIETKITYETGEYISKYTPPPLVPLEEYDFPEMDVDELEEAYNGTPDDFSYDFKQYWNSDEREALDHYLRDTPLEGEERDFYDLRKVGVGQLGDPNALAQMSAYGGEAAIMGSYDFNDQVRGFAQQYNIDPELAKQYLFMHEHVHLSQKGKYNTNTLEDTLSAERDVEETLRNYFEERAMLDSENYEKYSQLADIAAHRLHNVEANYAGGTPVSLESVGEGVTYIGSGKAAA